MVAITFIIAVVALVIAVQAYRKVGGLTSLESQFESLRMKTADAVEKLEKSLRGQKPG